MVKWHRLTCKAQQEAYSYLGKQLQMIHKQKHFQTIILNINLVNLEKAVKGEVFKCTVLKKLYQKVAHQIKVFKCTCTCHCREGVLHYRL